MSKGVSSELNRNISVTKRLLSGAHIRWAIFAGAAIFCYGRDRKVNDVDIIVKPEDFERAKEELKSDTAVNVDILSEIKMKTNEGTVRFFMDDEMLKRICWREFFDEIVPVISVEDNIVFKAIMQRTGDGKQDLDDLAFLIENYKVDVNYLKERICKCNAKKRVAKILVAFY